MKNIDINWLKKFKSIVDKLERYNSDYRQCSRCNKEVFVIRYFNKVIQDRSFKLRLKNRIYYAMFLSYKIYGNGVFLYKSCGINFYKGYGDSEFKISFFDANNTEDNNYGRIHWNDILDIQYEEISNEEFYKICKLYT